MTRKEQSGPIDRNAGARVRAIRTLRGVSQETLGNALGVTFQQVQKYEKGTNRIAISTLVAICKALKCHPMEIIGGDFEHSKATAVDDLASKNSALERCLSQIGTLARNPHQASEARQ